MQTIQHTPPTLSPISTEKPPGLELGLPSLKVISYQGPGTAGGVAGSLESIVKRLGTKVHWFAVTGLPKVFSHQFTFHVARAPSAVLEGHRKIASEYLWPLLHSMTDQASFNGEDWKSFRLLNEITASECLDFSSQSFPTLYWLHDYQMALMAPLIAVHAGIILAHFWHAPWPGPEVILGSPIGPELVDALLCNKLLGFQTVEDATNFLNTAKELFPDASIDHIRRTVRRRLSNTRIVIMPLGIDFAFWQHLAKSAQIRVSEAVARHNLSGHIILGVDRLDYSKRLLERLHGLWTFLTKYPNWHKRFHYVQISQPSEQQDDSMSKYASSVRQKISELNKTFGTRQWQPILFLENRLDVTDLAAWYQSAHVLVANSIHGGLSITAKEFVASRQDEQGVLIFGDQGSNGLEMSQKSLLTDPTSPDQLASAFNEALSMPLEEQRQRMSLMRTAVSANRLDDWAIDFLRKAVSV